MFLTNKWLLCFDLDGTILDSYKEGLRRLLEIARSKNLPMDDSVLKIIKTSWSKSATSVVSDAWLNTNANEIIEEWERKDAANPLPFVDGTRETLEKLRKFFFLGILTNRSRESTLHQLERLGDVFDFIYSAESFPKPHPESMVNVFKKCQELQINMGHISYIGDVPEADWQLAQNVNIKFLGVLSGVSTCDDFLKAGLKEKFIINSIADLPAYYEIDKLTPLR